MIPEDPVTPSASTRTRLTLALALAMIAPTAVLAADDSDPMVIELEQPLHFEAAGGGDVTVPVGRHVVEARESSLILRPADGGAEVALAAVPGEHTGQGLEQPYAVSVAGEGELAGTYTLAVAFPGGVTIECVGSVTGVVERGVFDKVKKAAGKTAKKVGSGANQAAKAAAAAAAKAKAEADRKQREAAAATAAAAARAKAESERKAREAAEAAAQAKAAADAKAKQMAQAAQQTGQAIGQGAQQAGQAIGQGAQQAGQAVQQAGGQVVATVTQGGQAFLDAAGNVLSEAERLRQQALCIARTKSLEAWNSGPGAGPATKPMRDLIARELAKPAVREALLAVAHAFVQRFAPEITQYGDLARVLNEPGNRAQVMRVLSSDHFCSNPASAIEAEIRRIAGRPLPTDLGTRGGTGLGMTIGLQGSLEAVIGAQGGHGVGFRSGTRAHWIAWLGGQLATDVGAEVALQVGFWPGKDPSDLGGPYFGVGIGGSVPPGSPVGFAVGIDVFFDRDPFTTGGFESGPAMGTGLRLRPGWVAEHFTGITITPFTGASAGVMPVEGQVEGGFTAVVLGF